MPSVGRSRAPWPRLRLVELRPPDKEELQPWDSVDFKAADSSLALVSATAGKVPTIVVVYLDRPAILTPLVPLAKTLIAEFGVSDGALFDALSGKVPPVGRLPFELPRSMEAVRQQQPDVPHDSKAPLYPIGYRWRP